MTFRSGQATSASSEWARVSVTEARTRVEHAAAVGTRRTITGETLPPQLPATAAGLSAGAIGPAQLRLIAETMAALPASVPEPVRERVEADLAGYARDYDPRRLRLLAGRLLATLDPDGPEPADGDPAPEVAVRGELWLRDRRDGVGMQMKVRLASRTTCGDDAADLGHRLDRADLVVHEHERDEDGVVA